MIYYPHGSLVLFLVVVMKSVTAWRGWLVSGRPLRVSTRAQQRERHRNTVWTPSVSPATRVPGTSSSDVSSYAMVWARLLDSRGRCCQPTRYPPVLPSVELHRL
ncbi:hypothetical protein B0T22DRAFT_239930 [Podospora appendiculata]|uniref:Uncharacterized protein n=1 Tax=Podospora appendiculata TaxID=314037 RepID=A0AAE0X6E6_9PEZI|nr:hypothetical protein B0T22DRAFT_239930 [Podospora appendiculata]